MVPAFADEDEVVVYPESETMAASPKSAILARPRSLIRILAFT